MYNLQKMEYVNIGIVKALIFLGAEIIFIYTNFSYFTFCVKLGKRHPHRVLFSEDRTLCRCK
jgi:hypothetical protein